MSESEKITINMAAVDLGKIDLLVREGLYTNRTDFIRTAIRVQLDKHNMEIQQSVVRNSFVIGAVSYDRNDLEKWKRSGEQRTLNILGVLHLHDDIPPELASAAIGTIKLLGIFIASDDVKAALAERMK
jgi:Arc/MetJ-type ribon-helix-helix transcriptional regulator